MRRMDMTESVANTVFLRSRAGKEEELAGRLEALVLASRSDPGVMIYDLHRSTADPALWFLYERYESQEHLNRHRENPVLRRFVADAATLFQHWQALAPVTPLALPQAAAQGTRARTIRNNVASCDCPINSQRSAAEPYRGPDRWGRLLVI